MLSQYSGITVNGHQCCFIDDSPSSPRQLPFARQTDNSSFCTSKGSKITIFLQNVPEPVLRDMNCERVGEVGTRCRSSSSSEASLYSGCSNLWFTPAADRRDQSDFRRSLSLPALKLFSPN
ncbi:hypothetical protein F2Q70_00023305 [Brassica cretica]|uniref:Uncharacterized protein n=1 Tax=Brassica cretica TaxID=69181 RepID=A0A8S9GML9_BRACR|nr:hypothetical protein F2Q70_00023305 [Brassica cretica]